MENSNLLELNNEEPDMKKEKNERNGCPPQNNTGDINSSYTSTLMDVSKTEPVCNSSNSIILEHLPTDNDSFENDCSYEEIELTNTTNQNIKEQSLAICMNATSKMHLDSESETYQRVDNYNEEFIKSIIYGILESSYFDDVNDTTFPSRTSNSFDLFEKINLSDSLLENYSKPDIVNENDDQNTKLVLDVAMKELLLKVKQLEEVVTVKEAALSVLTSEIESLKEIQSNNSSTLNSGTSTTEYKCIQEELQNKIADFQNSLAYRDSIIQQLTESLQQSVNRKEELQRESQFFLQEINLLKRQLLETSSLYSENKNKKKLIENETQTDIRDDTEMNCDGMAVWSKDDLPDLLLKLESQLNPLQMELFSDIKIKLYKNMDENLSKMYKKENCLLEDELTNKNDQELKIIQFNELVTGDKNFDFSHLRQELENKHTKEMEELRTYFEQKCIDLEKHYSEEVINSRKLSGSSYCSGNDFNSDVFLSNNEMGPGGDTFDLTTNVEKKHNIAEISKSDIQKLKDDLQKICTIIEAVDLTNVTNSELDLLVQDINMYDLKLLTKISLADIQNKNYAELELLREEYDNRINLMGVQYNKKMQDLERKHYEEISSLKEELQSNIHYQQEKASPGEYELAEVVQSYERRLQEQVMLAKIDIINALEYQIQMLVTNSDEDTEWPSELLQLRSKFTDHYEKKIMDMSAEHTKEIAKLKEEHMRNLNRAIKRRSLKDSFIQEELDILKERDNLQKCTSILRIVVTHLMKYFSECEEELNNSLLEEILKRNLDDKFVEHEDKLISFSSTPCSKRVHITPNVTEILATIDDSLSFNDVNIKELSVDLENELSECLGKLKDEANDILALTTSVYTNRNKSTIVNERISSLTRQLLSENKIKGDLIERLKETENYAKSLENEKINLDNHIEQLLEKQRVLENDLMYTKEKIAQMMDKEVVSEGYGERDDCNVSTFDEEIVSFNELQEKVRTALAEGSPSYNGLLQLVEDLCRAGEKLKIEAQREHIDLKQQIEAADKKIRATAQFLEEQTSEREQEREEALKEIILLKDLLKERERDRINCEQINKEVEHLEFQMREMSKLMEENELRTKEIELEKQEAVDKICILRDIIRDLEVQIEAKTATEEELKQLVHQLQQVIEQQNKSNEDLQHQLNSMQNVEHIQEHVEKLENEMQNLRLNTELIGKEGLLHQIKTELTDLEENLEKRTCDLEALHAAVSATSCSSPSEDMSIRDQIRPRAPSVTLEECHIPLQQLARLKEKLLVHSRAEDAAMKKIRDLEMHLENVKHELEESQSEKDILQDQVSQQLILISNLQMRLDEQRLRTEQVQKQNNTSLEVRIYDLENEIQSLKEIIQNRDKTIKHLTNGIEQTKQRLEDREKELLAKTEDVTYVEQQKQIEKLQEENELLKVRINCDAKSAQILPGLVDNIIADKNKDIEILRSKLNDTQKELESFLSLNLDKEQLKSLSNIKCSDGSASDFLSCTTNKEPEQLRKAEQIIEHNIENLPNPIFKRHSNDTILYFSHEDAKPKISELGVDISEIENAGNLNVNYTNEDMSLMQSHSTQLPQTTEKKRVHFSDLEDNPKVAQLRKEISARDETIKEYLERLKTLSNLEANLGDLQIKLELTEKLLKQATSNFEHETKRFSEIEKELKSTIHQNDKQLMEKDKELMLLTEDSKRKDEMYLSLAEEKRSLEKKLDEIQKETENYETLNDNIAKKNNHIECLEVKLTQMRCTMANLEDELVNTQKERDKLKEEHRKKAVEIEKKTEELETTKTELIYLKELNDKQGKEIMNKEKQIYTLMADLKESKYAIEDKERQIQEIQKKIVEEQKSLNVVEEKLQELQSLLIERETEIDNLNQEINRYHEENENFGKKEQLTDSNFQNLQLGREIAEKDLKIVKYNAEIDDLKYEVNNLQHLLNEKEKIINQITEDSKSLHVNLETIQNKMREGGNVFDLKKRLHDQQQLNAILTEQLKSLRPQSKNSEKEQIVVSIEDITGQVQKQLNYSALLDSNIISALNSNDDRKQHLNDAEYFKDSLTYQKEMNKRLQLEKEQLEEELSTLKENYQLKKNNVDKLEFLLEKERREFNCMQLENAGILEQMRVQLETALKNEMEFEELLQKERINHQETEKQLTMLRSRLATSNISDNSKTELTEYKSLPSPELNMLRNSLESLEKENQMLQINLKAIKKEQSESVSNLKYLKEILQFKNNEIEKLEEKLHEMKKTYEEVEKEHFQTKGILKQRSIEIENSRILINELEDDGRVMKKQIEELHEKLRVAEELKVIPDKFLKKMNELKHLVRQQVKDNRLMSETLSKLTNERQKLQLKVNELEAGSNMPFTDIAARANHLFARYLKSESNKKALVWQKRYLISLLATYQDFRLTTMAPLSTFDKNISNKSKPKSTKRFKILAISIVVVIRMQYLVRRWHSGKRFGAHLPSSYKYDSNAFNNLPTNFQIGQCEPRNQVNLSASIFHKPNSHVQGEINHIHSIENPIPYSSNTNTWMAVSPDERNNLDEDNVSGNGYCPPCAPNLVLTQYLERFDQIQKRLGIATTDNAV